MKTKADPISTHLSTERKRKKGDDVFAAAFKTCCKLLELKPELFGENPRVDDALFISQRSRNKKRICRLENEITPAAKEAAIERNRGLTAFLWRYFRRYGVPANIGRFIARMRNRRKSILTVTKVDGQLRTLTVRAVREMMRNKFGIKGKPGPKPR